MTYHRSCSLNDFLNEGMAVPASDLPEQLCIALFLHLGLHEVGGGVSRSRPASIAAPGRAVTGGAVVGIQNLASCFRPRVSRNETAGFRGN